MLSEKGRPMSTWDFDGTYLFAASLSSCFVITVSMMQRMRWNISQQMLSMRVMNLPKWLGIPQTMETIILCIIMNTRALQIFTNHVCTLLFLCLLTYPEFDALMLSQMMSAMIQHSFRQCRLVGGKRVLPPIPSVPLGCQ
jgi:hypothetical protein